jgi:RNA polymerase sigma-70 factor (ECF subfamily)
MPQLDLVDLVDPEPHPPQARGTAVGQAPWSFESLYRAHASTVARWALRLLGPKGDADDVVQDVFLVVQRRLPEFRGDAEITTWLYAITVRVAQRVHRRGRWWLWVTGRGQNPGRGRMLDRFVPPAEMSTDPQALLEARERTQLLYRLLDDLPESQRTTFLLFELEGLSGEEVAKITGISISAVWVRLSRARQRFVERMLAWEAKGKL